jgi:hypothetical protein
MVSLYSALKNSYSSNEEAKKDMIQKGYVLDTKLSSHNQKVYFNPKTKKILYTIAGTHNIYDVGTDLYLALGKLKDTKRYKEAKKILEKARKYYPSNTGVDVVGHSLGGTIASGIGKGKDNIISYNKGATIGQKSRDNEKSIRTSGDVVSALSSLNKNTITLDRQVSNLRGAVKHSQQPTFFKSHNLENLKQSGIMIDGFNNRDTARPVYDPNAGDSVAFQNYSLDD